MTVHWVSSEAQTKGAAERLGSSLAVGVRALFSGAECAAWARGVYEARAEWTAAFGGEQFSLGRAFYTHFEEARSRQYFEDAKASDARVEARLPGMQARMRAVVASLVSGEAFPRRGFCGAGVHVFPAKEKVAKRGGVIHFDTEGLSARHVASHRPALTVVAMIQAPERGGGLKVWDVIHRGGEYEDADLERETATVEYEVGDAVIIDSYRLHQIQPFRGARDRISITLHAAEVDPGRWETWF